LIQIYRSVKSNPQQLKDVSDFESLARAFLFMLDPKLSDDIDSLQMMASVGYLCVSKAIAHTPNNIHLYADRLLLLKIGHAPISYTVMSALNIARKLLDWASSVTPPWMLARNAIYKMQISDLELHPQLYQQVALFKEMKDDFNKMIERQFFMPEKTLDNVIKSGIESHKKLLEYIENKVIEENDMDF
jgi:hypothetical protein